LNFIHGNAKYYQLDLRKEFELYLPDILKNDSMISVNEYFDARVKSLGYTTTTGKSTVGVMEEGEYEFGTSTHETMIVIEGELIAQLPNETEWKSFKAGTSFEVAANAKFKVKSVGQSSYLCRYK
jgi:hypothetical protein